MCNSCNPKPSANDIKRTAFRTQAASQKVSFKGWHSDAQKALERRIAFKQSSKATH